MWLLKALEDGPYEFRNITPTSSTIPRYVITISEDPLSVCLWLLLAKAITQNFFNPTNNHLRASSNTKNQAIVQGDRVNIQTRNSGNVGRNNRRAYVQEEVVEGMNATNDELEQVKKKSLEIQEGLKARIKILEKDVQRCEKKTKSRDSHVKTSVLDVSKHEAKKEAVYVRKNKQTDNTFAKVVSNKENVIDVAVANASKAKTLLCVSCICKMCYSLVMIDVLLCIN
ncbi:hypothetical protein Tco_0117273 [Tanacetum coccineum]